MMCAARCSCTKHIDHNKILYSSTGLSVNTHVGQIENLRSKLPGIRIKSIGFASHNVLESHGHATERIPWEEDLTPTIRKWYIDRKMQNISPRTKNHVSKCLYR